jgi:disulfide bond formation protein DsbB
MTETAPSFTTTLRLCLAASVVSLAAALASQYGFGLKPCHLCIAQRVPFAVVIALALLGLWKVSYQKRIVLVIAAAFLINSVIASYHTAVEQHWVPGPTSCTTGEAPANQSMDDFLKRIQAAPIVACDQPQWDFHGITMAAMNAAWCLFLAAATFAATRQRGGRLKGDAHAQASR